MRSRSLRALALLSFTAALAAGCLPGTGPGGATTVPTTPPTSTATATPTAAPPSTAAPTTAPPGGTAIPGTWDALTTADGLCTDSPRLIGASFVAEGTTICSPSGTPGPSAPTAWTSLTVPEGDRATAAVRFPPGGGLVVATDDGPCIQGVGMPGTWDCHPAASGFPHTDITGLANIGIDAVYALPDSIAFVPDLLETPGTTWSIPSLVGAADAIVTRFATVETPTAEVWSGTNGHGVVVLDITGGTTTRHTTSDGLPSGDVRDLAAGATDPKFGPGLPMWAATAGGVARWDGSEWTSFTSADGLPSNDVRAIAVTAGGAVWVATAGGPASFDGTAWHGYGSADGVDVDVMDVAATAWGVWFATPADGLLVFVEG